MGRLRADRRDAEAELRAGQAEVAISGSDGASLPRLLRARRPGSRAGVAEAGDPAVECRLRSLLESDHIRLGSRGGSLETWNQAPPCAPHHRYLEHQVGGLSIRGVAPDDLEVTMGESAYRNDAIVVPVFKEDTLDEDQWGVPGISPWGWEGFAFRMFLVGGSGVP